MTYSRWDNGMGLVSTPGIPFLALAAILVPALAAARLTAQSQSANTPLATPGSTTLVLPAKDSALQADLERVLNQPQYRRLVRQRQISVALVDLSNPFKLRYAGVDDDRMRYAASLPKIAVMLAVFDQVDRGRLKYTPELTEKLERMIRRSSNADATDLIELVGFQAIANTLRDPRYELYSPSRRGGLWVGRDYGGGRGLWRRDPLRRISHGATARQTVRFFVMLDQQRLVSPWASVEMKRILSHPEINSKFVRGLQARPGSQIFRKSGTWQRWHADAALVEREGKRYIAVALLESGRGGGILSDLIVQLDDIVAPVPVTAEAH
jgi:beta-lactamase class A